MQDQQLPCKLIFRLAAALMAVATSAAAPAAEHAVPPNAAAATVTQAAQPDASDKPIQSVGDKQFLERLTLPPSSDPSFWSSFEPGAAGQALPGNTFNAPQAPSSISASPARDQLRVGNSYVGVQTEKNVQVLRSLKGNECADDDECAEYSGLPKPQQPKTSARNFKRPYIGLSLTRPLE